MRNNQEFDVAIVGAGVVGCAMARRFVLQGASVILLEKSSDILSGASKANSAILHTAFDAPTGSIEQHAMQQGYQEYLEIRHELNLPLLESGAMVVAWNDEQLEKLSAIAQQAHDNGVNDVALIDAAAVMAREPMLSNRALGALWVPREHLIDPWSAPLAYLKQAVENGGKVQLNAEVKQGTREHDIWHLQTTVGDIYAKTVINCAGNYGDQVDQCCLGETEFTIHPRKGQFVVFDKAAYDLLKTIILPVPTARTKGVVLTRTIFGNLLVGPTAEEQDDRMHATVEQVHLQQLIDKAVEILPALAGMPVTAIYAGLRPATEHKAYQIKDRSELGWITVGGIRSTGLTAALGIAQHVYTLYQKWGQTHVPLASPITNPVPNLAEHLARPWMEEGRSEIVCHCERVTHDEIINALAGPVAAGDWGGLKRRTRACMGRCQGFHCSAAVATIADPHFALTVGKCHE